jgi:hypothetical protein
MNDQRRGYRRKLAIKYEVIKFEVIEESAQRRGFRRKLSKKRG